MEKSFEQMKSRERDQRTSTMQGVDIQTQVLSPSSSLPNHFLIVYCLIQLPPAATLFLCLSLSLSVSSPWIQESSFPTSTERPVPRRAFWVIFVVHYILVIILTIVLSILGLFSAHNRHFRPKKWYPPLLTSVACAGIVAFTWQGISKSNPSKAFTAVFWISPVLTCAMGVLLMLIPSAGSITAGAIAVLFSIIQSLYGCWVTPRFKYATKVLLLSIAFPPAKTTVFIILSLLASILCSSFAVFGIGQATASRTGFDPLFICLILLSLAWTAQVIKNIVLVSISRVKYMHFAIGEDFSTSVAIHDTIRSCIGSVCLGSVLAPIVGIIHGSARTMKLLEGERGEVLFSCADCYSGIASSLINYGNRWGFVHVGVYNKGFVQASADTWELFRTTELETLINSDLTGSFCFLSGIGVGAISGLLSGIWAFAIHESHATEVTLYAFLIGYFMCRIAMAWLQACVSAYYVSYAENPHNTRFDWTIPERIQEIQRHQEYNRRERPQLDPVT